MLEILYHTIMIFKNKSEEKIFQMLKFSKSRSCKSIKINVLYKTEIKARFIKTSGFYQRDFTM